MKINDFRYHSRVLKSSPWEKCTRITKKINYYVNIITSRSTNEIKKIHKNRLIDVFDDNSKNIDGVIIEDKKGLKKNSLLGTSVKQEQDSIKFIGPGVERVAEELTLSFGKKPSYLATAINIDDEMNKRINVHKKRRKNLPPWLEPYKTQLIKQTNQTKPPCAGRAVCWFIAGPSFGI